MPVMLVVGKVPMFPLIVVELTAPAKVIPEPASIAKLLVVKSGTFVSKGIN
jgi:hypothetical protein